MTISSASVDKDGVVSSAGGTAKALTSLGDTANSHNAFFEGPDFLTRNVAEFSTKTPKVSSSAPNGYTQQRSNLKLKFPLALDNGNVTINTVDIGVSCDIETTDAEKDTILSYAAQFLSDTDFSAFWKNQSVE